MALLSNKLGKISTFSCDANTFFIHRHLIINKERIELKNRLYPVKLGNEQKHTILRANCVKITMLDCIRIVCYFFIKRLKSTPFYFALHAVYATFA